MAEKKNKATKTKTPTAKKREMQNEKKRLRTKIVKSRVRTTINQINKGLSSKEPAESIKKQLAESIKKQLNALYSLVDKGLKKKVFKKNKASRIKASFAGKVNRSK